MNKPCPSCGLDDYYVLTVHPTGGILVECVDCHYRWTIQESSTNEEDRQ